MSEIEIAIKAVQLYAEMHPRPPHVTQTQAAQMIGVCKWLRKKRVINRDCH